ncbi:MAG: hypothetical protein JO126_00500 [Alphaproteobacteria bacterium]|nr:hypothetical protein [Alphaproteobacteria bacterium]MBV8547919.1 hypothetical protein [Alphaproteobacteria bacterium]
MGHIFTEVEEGVFRAPDADAPGGYRYRITNTKLRALGEPDENSLPVGLAKYPDIIDDCHVLLPHVEIVYDESDHVRWCHLFHDMEKTVPGRVAQEVADGFAWIRKIGGAERIPTLEMMNKDITAVSGFKLVQVMGLVPHNEFFKLLMDGKFPVTLSIRRENEFSYTSFPDIFHDLAGHAPMFLNEIFCDFVRKIGALGWKFRGDSKLQGAVSKIYWYTIEFGLKRAAPEQKQSCIAYGAGIVSSVAETQDSVESEYAADFDEQGNRSGGKRAINRLPFDLRRVLHSHYDYAQPQELYFVIDDYVQLSGLFDGDLEDVIRTETRAGGTVPQGTLLPTDKVIPTFYA